MMPSALFREGTGVHDAVNGLVDAGFERDRLLVVLPRDMADSPLLAQRQESVVERDMNVGAVLGALLGGLVMIGAFALAGPLGALVVSGTSAGALGGSLVGLLVGTGVSADLASAWITKVGEGCAVVGLRGHLTYGERAHVLAILVAAGGDGCTPPPLGSARRLLSGWYLLSPDGQTTRPHTTSGSALDVLLINEVAPDLVAWAS